MPSGTDANLHTLAFNESFWPKFLWLAHFGICTTTQQIGRDKDYFDTTDRGHSLCKGWDRTILVSSCTVLQNRSKLVIIQRTLVEEFPLSFPIKSCLNFSSYFLWDYSNKFLENFFEKTYSTDYFCGQNFPSTKVLYGQKSRLRRLHVQKSLLITVKCIEESYHYFRFNGDCHINVVIYYKKN